MSSIVNKSGVRFAPKVRQRRTAAAPPVAPTPSILLNKNDETSDLQEATLHEDDPHAISKDMNVRTDSFPDTSSTAVADSQDPLSQSTQVGSRLSVPNNGRAMSITSTSPFPGRRSSRLDSLSGNSNRITFKSPYGSTSETPTERRLSTISNDSLNKRMRLNSITAESDPTLQSLKKRRLSSKGSIAKRGSSSHRISVVSKIEPPRDKSASPTDIEGRSRDGSIDHTESGSDKKLAVRTIKQIPRNITDEDSSNYQIDEEHFTMAELCKPYLPIGEISENFERAQEAAKAKLERRKQRKQLRERAKTEFRSIYSLNKEEIEAEKSKRLAHQKVLEAEENAINAQPTADSAIRVKIIDGKMAVDDESLVLDRHSLASAGNAMKERKDDNPFENLYNSATYGKGSFTDPWTSEELIKFYKALSMWGTDFNLIAQMYPYRTRKQVKAKFINEEKKHPIMIELALRSKLPPKFDEYCSDIKKEIGTVEDFNKKIEELQRQHEEHFKEIELAKSRAAQEDNEIERKKMETHKNRKSAAGFMSDDLKVYRKQEVVLGTIDDMKMRRVTKNEEEDENL
ncbi:Transcription factor TFIIIB component B'' [Nakaseomyces bracarensis]|uniref:Transcription factor TFIIIB component B n=1 Tax=Nakaseomyces bracarensis TaxID=273131 RepID=A0ABR4NRG9_9SACH